MSHCSRQSRGKRPISKLGRPDNMQSDAGPAKSTSVIDSCVQKNPYTDGLVGVRGGWRRGRMSVNFPHREAGGGQLWRPVQRRLWW